MTGNSSKPLILDKEPPAPTLEHIEWADVKTVAKYFGINRGVQYRLIAAGHIRSCSLADVGASRGKRLICLASVRKYLNQQAEIEALRHIEP